MTLLDVLRACRRSWPLLVAVTLLGAAAGVLVTAFVPPVYRADAQMFVSVRASDDDASELVQGSSAAQQKVTSYIEVVRSASVLQPVINELGLDEDVARLAEHVQASSPSNTVLLDVSVVDDDPDGARRIAAAICASFAEVVTTQLERPADGGASLVGVETIQPPGRPTSPVSPSLPRNLALGTLAGVATGVALVLLRSAVDTRVRTREDVQTSTGSPVIGDIGFDPDARTRPLVVHEDPRNPLAEAFRALRTNVQFIGPDDTGHALTVTSAVPAEGKSTTAANLALTLAEAGARVALVDADLRRPRLAEMLGVEGASGLTDILIGRAEIDDVLVPWGRGGLRVLPTGAVPPNPSELLGSEAMRRLLDTLSAEHDAVVIDAPPLLPVTDAAILARLTGGAVLVCAVGRTSRQQLRDAVAALDGVGSRALGVVLTMRRAGRGEPSAYYSRVGATASSAAPDRPSAGRRARPQGDTRPGT